jgi:uncharacterized cupin superfamily protein
MTADELRAKLIRSSDVPTVHTAQTVKREPLYDYASSRLAIDTAARELGATVVEVAPGKRACPYHFHHAEEELFVVLAGEGSLRIAGELLAIRTGDVIFIPAGPEYPHQLINTSHAPLKYLCVSTQAAAEVCEYPDSNKYQAWSRSADTLLERGRVHRSESSLDYWDGEP